MRRVDLFLAISIGIETALGAFLLSKPGQSAAIPSWDIQTTAKVGNNLKALSRTGIKTSSWHQINTSRCTLMGCLIHAGVYHEDDLFYSDNLNNFDAAQFHDPWVYRKEFVLDPGPKNHYFLQTNGISSKGDIFINGNQVANRASQAGAYGGHVYDISAIVEKENGLAVQVYPTDYDYDFAIGFVDWNPYPPDNGTGVWRDIELKRTGPVALTPLRVVTKIDLPVDDSPAQITMKSTVRNLETHAVTVAVTGKVGLEAGDKGHEWSQVVHLGPLQSQDLVLATTFTRPKIWWPKQWGQQPLYFGQLSVAVDHEISDNVHQTFGIRNFSSTVNKHNDITFYVNGNPFQILGAGYSGDMFLRWDPEKFTQQARLLLASGGNAIRLEGKMEQPELFDIADRMGLVVLAGWECCDKWEAWSYNEDLAVKSEWTESDYDIANASIRHEALMMQGHPSLIAFLVGSDYWPNDRAAQIYTSSLRTADWQVPIVASASKRGYPSTLGPSGMKMDGPYDWVPPNYWYDVEPAEDRLGAAFGFGSELGSGVGTPETGSLKKFLSKKDLNDLWRKPEVGLYHMSTNVSSFHNRKIYNDALWRRLGAPESLDDYILKAQIMDYEATRSQFEAVSAFWSKDRPATGLIYWMLTNAWPSLHWNLFDYHLNTAGSYFGAKTGSRIEHVAYDYLNKTVYLINHSIDKRGPRHIGVELIDMNGKALYSTTRSAETQPNTSKDIIDLSSQFELITDVAFLRLILRDGNGVSLSRNVYWLANTVDTLDWDDSDWFFTPVTQYANYISLSTLHTAKVLVSTTKTFNSTSSNTHYVMLENFSPVPAFFIRLSLVDQAGDDVAPVIWSENYVTLWPHEKLELQVEGENAAAIHISGGNIAKAQILLDKANRGAQEQRMSESLGSA
ncbi:glycoside hydrolase family 2 protein [Xylariaceae sp. FL1019]|nr:glycoside hydrolase family 2 protein [Xylariaceae sp. FL1019]